MTSSVVARLQQALSAGYQERDFFFSKGKDGPGAKWPDRELPRSWERSKPDSLAIRLHTTTARIAGIDIDVADEAMCDAIYWAMCKVLPGLSWAPIRGNTKNGKICIFVRTTERFGRFATKHYKPDEDTPGQMVEAYGGAFSKYFVVTGAHDIQAGSQYTVVDMQGTEPVPKLWEVRPEDLPEYTPDQIAAALDVAAKAMVEAGWYTKEALDPNKVAGGTLYDLHDGMRFLSPELDGEVTLEELKAAAPHSGSGEGLPVYMTFLEGRGEDMNPNRANALVTAKGLLITEWPDTKHYEASAAPVTPGPGAGLPASLKASTFFDKGKRADADYGTPEWLLARYAYDPSADLAVTIEARGRRRMKLGALKEMLRPYPIEVGTPDKPKQISPVVAWGSLEERILVHGQAMRPDRPTPLFVNEEGVQQLNTYYPPSHPEGGETKTFHRFLASMVPDKEERAWLLAQLAYKMQHPEVAGPGTVLVAADTYGTGRGTLFIILGKLLGEQFCHQVDFGMITGRNAGARFNSWQAENLVVTIEEAAGDEDADTLRGRTAAFEVLKTKIEPNSQRMISIEKKGVDQTSGKAFATFFIATNHRAAIRFPNENDRRLCVITCGDKLPAKLAQAIYDWLEQPENIGALYCELQAVDISKTSFRPYAPPPLFKGKLDMIEASKTDLDRLWDRMLEEYPAELITPSIAASKIERMNGPRPQHAESIIRRWVTERLVAVGTYNDRVMVNGTRERAFARTREKAEEWVALPAKARHSEVAKGAQHDNTTPTTTPRSV